MSLKKTPNKRKPMNLQLQKRLATYSTAANLAALSGLALSGVAHAGSIGHDIPDVTLTVGQTLGIDFDEWTLGGGPVTSEFQVKAVNVFNDAIYLDRITTALDSGQSAVGFTTGGFHYAKALDGSISVGPSRTDFVLDPIFYLGYGTGGQFPGAGDKYAGVRFYLDGNTVNYYYGWILLNVAADSTSVTIKAYGYNDTPNTGIPTAVNLLEMKADAVAPWWRQAAVGAFSMLTALSLWWRRRVSRRLSE